MKTGHIADLHHSPERHTKVMRILDQVKEISPDIDLFTNSGENFNNPYNFTETSGFNALLDKWKEITSLIPVATIRATQGAHERPGMVETLQRVGVKILEPGQAYGFYPGKFVGSQKRKDLMELDGAEGLKMLLFGVPHPHKANILSKDDKRLGREEANAKVNQSMVDLYKYYGAIRANNPDVPALAVGHGVVQGKNTRDLHAIKNSSIYSTEAELKLMGCDFYAWGHYHNPTEFELIRGRYLASFAWDFNELDYKPAITIIDWDTMEIKRHELDINVRKKIVMFPGDTIPDLTGCDVHLINNQTEWTESDCKDKGAGLVKITTEVEKENKIRSEEVVKAKSHQDKFKAVYPDATDRQLQVCEEMWEADKASGKIPHKKTIRPLWCEVHGSKLFMERMDKETVKIDYRDLTDGLSMLIGPGGHGKSSIMDYSSPFSLMFGQPNSLLSTFELADSYIKQGWEINGKEYKIIKFFKPTLKNPKAEYYAFEGESKTPITGLDSGNKGPYDEWCLQMFGTPRKYSTSVYNTQFDDNPASFAGQKVNPSIFQANNVELKALFHELAGTDKKHLEMKCKAKADEFKVLSEKEVSKRSGVEESIPDKTILEEKISGLKTDVGVKKEEKESINGEISALNKQVEKIQKLESENIEIESSVKTLQDQRKQAEDSKSDLEKELSESGNIDINEVTANLAKMDEDKVDYEKKLKDLSSIKERNTGKQKEYMSALEMWNTDNLSIVQHNSDVDSIKRENLRLDVNKESAERRKSRAIEKAKLLTEEKNRSNKSLFELDKQNLNENIRTIEDQIKTGNEMIENISACPECGYVDPEGIKKKESYKERLSLRETELETKKKELSEMTEPEPVTIPADTTEEDKEIAEADNKKDVPQKKDVPDKPVEPGYEDEMIPAFDMDKYNSLKEKVSSYSEERITTLQTQIREKVKSISDLQSQIDSKEKHEIDYTPKESLKTKETLLNDLKSTITGLETDIKVLESKISDINKMRESLIEYDKRIEDYNSEFEFWSDMRVKWGPKGIPARILEHTGPYVDQMANDVLKRFYPVYRMHSETTKIGADGKELEVFNIKVLNQETGREKPINSISGEERNFVSMAMEHAFRTINQENSMEFWDLFFIDEPDAHVSSLLLQEFWDMVEYTVGKNKAVCISHSPEIKHRSGTTMDIRSL